MPPVLTNNTAWTRGYFINVAHEPLCDEDVLSVHCFWDDPFKRYVDEYGNPLPQRHEPCGFFALSGDGAIDMRLSKALGIPLPYDPDAPTQNAQEAREKLASIATEAQKLPPRRSSQMRALLRNLLDDLEAIAEHYEEVYDTDPRDAMSSAVVRGFVFAESDYVLPRKFGMFARKGDAAVRRSLERYIEAALAQAKREGLDDPAKRLASFEDIEVCSGGGESYDTFFGSIRTD